MKPIAAKHGAAACLGKPIAPQKLRCALNHMSRRCLTCDRWGGLLPEKTGAPPHFRGIAAKLCAQA